MDLIEGLLEYPKIGDIKRGRDIGKATNLKYGWYACENCGKERWVHFVSGAPRSSICKDCNDTVVKNWIGENHPRWKGGRLETTQHYIRTRIYKDDPFYSMADCRGYALEHRLVVAKTVNRCLQIWEVVHHKNGITTDNRVENLELLPSQSQHLVSTLIQAKLEFQSQQIATLEKRVTSLEAENIVLRERAEG